MENKVQLNPSIHILQEWKHLKKMEGILNQKHNYLKINLMKVQRLIFNLHPTITFFNLTLKQYENKE